MATSYGALCTDFYINQKLSLKMDLPTERETILHLFEQVRKVEPGMTRFRRYEGELSLESSRRDGAYQWMALRRTNIRTGQVNPDNLEQAYGYHRRILETTPYHLTISPLDVDYLELMFGFDLESKGNHDAIVYQALYEDSPLSSLLNINDQGKVMDVQPVFGFALTPEGDEQCYFEVKTRGRSRRGNAGRYREEPISIFLTVRRYGPVDTLTDLPAAMDTLANRAEELANDKLVPDLLAPIARHITSSSA